MYPHVSRTIIANALGKHLSLISNYFSGRVVMPMTTAIKVAAMIGVDVETLARDLEEMQREYRRERARAARTRAQETQQVIS